MFEFQGGKLDNRPALSFTLQYCSIICFNEIGLNLLI